MTKENKDLLMRDLSARLPYGVKCKLSANGESLVEDLQLGGLSQFLYGRLDVFPYLRPMSSMTEEEKEELSVRWLWTRCFDDFTLAYLCDSAKDYVACSSGEYFNLQDWLNAHHFDYRGLIEKGLALEAPEGMYNEIKEEKK